MRLSLVGGPGADPVRWLTHGGEDSWGVTNSSRRGWLSPKELLRARGRPWATAEDQVKVAASAGHVEVAFSLSKWPLAPVISGAGR
ncbi:hypothetical protein Stube_27720 [Streptomyces tubercidicus]|uniref:Uncharacterized protein n=1 Tax=Streptomyces tubercidicus TaxID=47759 RepID=A0A640UQU7_9ACTN|nr:hypothetical protein Stube_27720 [Streptomyces tubercidicus]